MTITTLFHDRLCDNLVRSVIGPPGGLACPRRARTLLRFVDVERLVCNDFAAGAGLTVLAYKSQASHHALLHAVFGDSEGLGRGQEVRVASPRKVYPIFTVARSDLSVTVFGDFVTWAWRRTEWDELFPDLPPSSAYLPGRCRHLCHLFWGRTSHICFQ